MLKHFIFSGEAILKPNLATPYIRLEIWKAWVERNPLKETRPNLDII